MKKTKILIIGVNWLGDIIMTLPAIKEACKAGEVTVVTRPHLASVYNLFGLPVKTVSISTNASLLQVFRETKQCRMEKFDFAITFPNSLRAAIVAKMCKAKCILGFNAECRFWLLNKALNLPQNYTKIHESRLYAILTSEIGCKEPDYKLSAPGFSEEQFTKATQKAGINPGSPYIILAPGAAFGAAKRWPPHKFAEVAKMIADKFTDIQIAITASKNENNIAEEIISLCPSTNIINASGKTDIIELAIILSKAKTLIANDSGTMHLAALYSTPTVVPVGPTDMVRTGALNQNFRPIIADSCEKIPCRQRVCPLKHHICMESIEPQTVFETAESFLYTKKY